MLPAHLRPVLVELSNRLRAHFEFRFHEVRLFGSYARGEANEESDVDVLVLIRELQPSEVAVVTDITTSLRLETGIGLAPLPMASERFTPHAPGRRFMAEVEREGERI